MPSPNQIGNSDPGQRSIKGLKEHASSVEERAGKHYDKMQQLREDIKNS